MAGERDVERGGEYKLLESNDSEEQALLPTSSADVAKPWTGQSTCFAHSTSPKYNVLQLSAAFVAGAIACMLGQIAYNSCCSFTGCQPNTVYDSSSRHVQVAPTHVGNTEIHNFPPATPTNAFPSLFPSDVGYAGPTPTGAEPGVVKTAPAYPIHTGAPVLVRPTTKEGAEKSGKTFDTFKYWGNLSPWYSIDKGAFGVDSGPEPPEECVVTGLHFLHRHGARYPTQWSSYAGPAKLARHLHDNAASWTASGELLFLNNWSYKLGEEVLTPFGRQQLYDLGVSLRIKYGFLLENFTATNTIPVFRTESQDRMLHSALNFAVGFFGLPLEGKYQQSITIEADGHNNTLAPYKTCPNAQDPTKGDRSIPYVKEWAGIYLADARTRLNEQIDGFEFSIEDVYTLQQMCAYETVAIGYSRFCELFTEKEWESFEYALDLYFWYTSAFGSPLARVQGIGYIQELVARLTSTPIETHNSSTNATLNDNAVTFPLDQSLYVDATHEVVVLNIITALNLTSFAANGPLPADHIPANRTFVSSQLAPFATNIQFQLLSCTDTTDPQIRIIINDGVAPLTGIRGCDSDKHGRCAVDTFVSAQKELIAQTDWIYDCHGDWSVPAGPAWNTTTGDSPKS